MKLTKLILLFLVVNFGGLAIGNWFMDNGPLSSWYINLNKAPWTPPGFVFGIAWTTIMICFSIYLGKLFLVDNTIKLRVIFILQVILNVSWNFIFFHQHLVLLGLLNLLLLTSIIFYFYFKRSNKISKTKFLLLPYMIWLCIATSLNLYILMHN